MNLAEARFVNSKIAELEAVIDKLRRANRAQTAPARFRRITKRTKVTAPCVLARIVEAVAKDFWVAKVFYDQADVNEKRGDYTHWLPIEFPEVGR